MQTLCILFRSPSRYFKIKFTIHERNVADEQKKTVF